MSRIKTGDWVAEAKKKLSAVSETPGLDGQVLAAHVLGKTRTQILAYPDEVLSQNQLHHLDASLVQLLSGDALPYVLGYWEFYGRRFKISRDVLIPRPETELLVENAAAWLKRRDEPLVAAEVGIGSGCISISLAKEAAGLNIYASDISMSAVLIARQNIADYHLQGRIYVIQGSLLSAYQGPFDLIAANLPYIPTSELGELKVSHREPWIALDGGENGMKFLDRLLADSPRLLKEGGLMLMEIEEKQSEGILKQAKHVYPDAKIEVLMDLNRKPRLLRIERISH